MPTTVTTDYKPTIGLEIHAELKTSTKMFCNSKNDPDETDPNANICPVCMGHPGTLPVINKEAVKHILKLGIAVEGELADFTEFDRKNYFYPDIPKGYQISQYEHPLVSGGSLCDIELTRIHLEEDTARSTHTDDNYSLVDFNRAGIPLMELVTEPVIESATQAGDFARELQLLLRFLGAGDANMEKGEMRIEANVSVSKTEERGTKVEVKNINSFKAVEQAIEYEIERQIRALESGEEVNQETRGWDAEERETFSQRTKETSEDYRYFPDPDLPSLKITEVEDFHVDKLTAEIPELPNEKRHRYEDIYEMKHEDVDVFLHNPALAFFFEQTIDNLSEDSSEKVQTAINYITSDLVGALDDLSEIPIDPKYFSELVEMIEKDIVSSRGAKKILEVLLDENRSPEEIAEEEGLLQESSEDALLPTVEKIIEEHRGVADEYLAGKESALQFLIGQGMRKTGGSANPQVLAKLFKKKLD